MIKKITLIRPKESFNKNCVYDILIDGIKRTELKNGEEKTIEIPDNSEFIKAKLMWTGSKTIALKKNENTIIVTGDKLLNKLPPFVGGILILVSLTFTLNHDNDFIKGFGFSFFSILVVYFIGILTFWRHKWLHMEFDSWEN